MAKEKLAEQLKKEAIYAQESLLRDLLYEVYGKAEMAYQLEAISKDDFLEINHMTVYFINTHARELAEGEKNGIQLGIGQGKGLDDQSD